MYNKLNKRQLDLHTDGKYYILEAKANSSVEATVAFVEKVPIKNTAVLRASKKLMITLDYMFQPLENPDLEDKIFMLRK